MSGFDGWRGFGMVGLVVGLVMGLAVGAGATASDADTRTGAGGDESFTRAGGAQRTESVISKCVNKRKKTEKLVLGRSCGKGWRVGGS